jgi:rhodanese-related sulfurtransferase
MINKTLVTAFLLFLSFGSFANFTSLSPGEVASMKAKGIVVIDIRRTDEWENGIIAGSHKLMFFDGSGRYNFKKWLGKFSELVKSKKQPFILYCAHGNRSKTVGRALSDKLGYKKVYDLQGGVENGWLSAGFKLSK